MRLVSIKTVAESLMIKQSTLYSWVHSRSIPFHKLNGLIRFDMEEIEQWVKMSKQPCNADRLEIRKDHRLNIDNIVKKAIADAKDNRYNPSNGKPGQLQGLRKEA